MESDGNLIRKAAVFKDWGYGYANFLNIKDKTKGEIMLNFNNELVHIFVSEFVETLRHSLISY